MTSKTMMGSCIITITKSGTLFSGPVNAVTWTMSRPASPRYSSLSPHPVRYVHGKTVITGVMQVHPSVLVHRPGPFELVAEIREHGKPARQILLRGVRFADIDPDGSVTFSAESITHTDAPNVGGLAHPAHEGDTVIVLPRLFGDVGELTEAIRG